MRPARDATNAVPSSPARSPSVTPALIVALFGVTLATGCSNDSLGGEGGSGGGAGASGGSGGSGASAGSGGSAGGAGSGGLGGGGGGGVAGSGGSGGTGFDPACFNGAMDGTETDVDCGGGACPECDIGQMCFEHFDCRGILRCSGRLCVNGCSDFSVNQGETDIDCGGPISPGCRAGRHCGTDDDCRAPLTCEGGTCVDGCLDGQRDGDESDVDCGGPRCALCRVGDECRGPIDCEVGLDCVAGQCAGTCDNSALDSGEVDVDCGGICPRCDVGQLCTTDADCFSETCDSGGTGRCVIDDVPLDVRSLCAIHTNYDTFGSSLCRAARVPSVLDLTKEQIDSYCRPGTDAWRWGQDLLEAAVAGRITIDWTLARTCLAQSRTLRARSTGRALLDGSVSPGSDWQALANGVCHDFYQPAVTEGGECFDAWDCVEPLQCASVDPFAVDGARCLQPAGDGEACGPYRSCAADFYCMDVTCVPRLADGEPCSYDLFGDDCLSTSCAPVKDTCFSITSEAACGNTAGCVWDAAFLFCDSTYACAPLEPLAALGEPCADAAECADECVTCRPATAGAPATCELPVAPGEPCAADEDCMPDQLCIDGTCDNHGRGVPCYGGGECAPGYACLPPVNCLAFDDDSVNCGCQTVCFYNPATRFCDPYEGECQRMPRSGPCALGLYCDASAYCEASGTCVPRIAPGGACFPDAPCVSGHVCLAGVCEILCETNADCDSGEYCDLETQLCLARPSDCVVSGQCDDGELCADAESVCPRYQDDRAACEGDLRCTFLPDHCTLMNVDCIQYDNNQVACGAAGPCTYDSSTGFCDPDRTIDCGAHSGDAIACADTTGCQVLDACGVQAWSCAGLDDIACGTATGCRWNGTTSLCERVIAQCTPRYATGERCNPDLAGDDCRSADCAFDESAGVYRCAVSLSRGCNRESEFLRAAFLFGVVWVAGRAGSGVRRRRRAQQRVGEEDGDDRN